MPAKSAVEDRRLHLHEGVVAQDEREPAEDRHHDRGDDRHLRQPAGQRIARRQREQDRRDEDLGGEEDLLELPLAVAEPLRHRRHAVGEEEDRDRPDLEEELEERMDVAFGGAGMRPDIAAPRGGTPPASRRGSRTPTVAYCAPPQASLTRPKTPERWWKRRGAAAFGRLGSAKVISGAKKCINWLPSPSLARLLFDVGHAVGPVEPGGDRRGGDEPAVPGKAVVADEERPPDLGRACRPKRWPIPTSGSRVKWPDQNVPARRESAWRRDGRPVCSPR